MRATAELEGIPWTSFRRHLKAVRSENGGRDRGRPSLLTQDEETALGMYVSWLEFSGLPAENEDIANAVTELRKRRIGIEALEPVTQRSMRRFWIARWRKRHPELRKSLIKAVDRDRAVWEASNREYISQWFEKLDENITSLKIGPSEIWNEDECGIRIGMLNERFQVTITRTTRARRPRVINPGNRESCTLLGCANAVGDALPPWLVFKVFPAEAWAHIDGHPEMRFVRSDSGFSNAEITLDWLQTFNSHSWKASAKAQRSGKSLTQWFGCGEHLRDAAGTVVNQPCIVHKKEEKIWRLLSVDGFQGHIGLKCAQYCLKFDILLVKFPPHSTHMMQSLDVGVFQSLKKQHQHHIKEALRDGFIAFTHKYFLRKFTSVFLYGFKRSNIISGFKKSGLWPPSAMPVLCRLAEAELKAQKPLDAGLAMYLRDKQRFARANAFLGTVISKTHDEFTRSQLRHVQTLLDEASIMDRDRNRFMNDIHEHTEKQAHKTQRGATVRPSGLFMTSVSLQELEAAEQSSSQRQERLIHNRELFNLRHIIIQEIKALEDAWRASRDDFYTHRGHMKRVTLREWLIAQGRLKEYKDLQRQRKEFTKEMRNTPTMPSRRPPIDKTYHKPLSDLVIAASSSPVPPSPIPSDFYDEEETDDGFLDFLDDSLMPNSLKMPSSPPTAPERPYEPTLPPLPPPPPSTPPTASRESIFQRLQPSFEARRATQGNTTSQQSVEDTIEVAAPAESEPLPYISLSSEGNSGSGSGGN